MNNGKHYYSLSESLSEAGARLIERDLKAEQAAGKLSRDEYLHLVREKRLTAERRDLHDRMQKFLPVQFAREPDEGLL